MGAEAGSVSASSRFGEFSAGTRGGASECSPRGQCVVLRLLYRGKARVGDLRILSLSRVGAVYRGEPPLLMLGVVGGRSWIRRRPFLASAESPLSPSPPRRITVPAARRPGVRSSWDRLSRVRQHMTPLLPAKPLSPLLEFKWSRDRTGRTVRRVEGASLLLKSPSVSARHGVSCGRTIRK